LRIDRNSLSGNRLRRNLQRLSVGTASTDLPIDSNGGIVLTDAGLSLSLTGEGSLPTINSTGAVVSFPVGSTGQVLSVSSTSSTNLVWETLPAAGSTFYVFGSTGIGVSTSSNSTWVANTEPGSTFYIIPESLPGWGGTGYIGVSTTGNSTFINNSIAGVVLKNNGDLLTASGLGGTATLTRLSAGTLGQVLIVSTAAPDTSPLAWSGQLIDSGGSTSIDYINRYLVNESGDTVIDYQSLQLLNTSGNPSVDWGASILYDNDDNPSVAWNSRHLIDADGNEELDWNNFLLINGSGNTSVDWNNAFLEDDDGATSIDWNNRHLIDELGINAINFSKLNRHLMNSTGNLVLNFGGKYSTGDVLVYNTAQGFVREAIGTQGQVLSVASTSSTSTAWISLSTSNISGYAAPSTFYVLASTGIAVSTSGNSTWVTNISTGSGGGLPTGTRSQVLLVNPTGANTNPTWESGLYDTSDNLVVDPFNYYLWDNGTNNSIDWNGRKLYDASPGIALNYNSRILYGSDGNEYLNWDIGMLWDDGPAKSVDWVNHELFDTYSLMSIDYDGRLLTDKTGTSVLTWGNSTGTLGFFGSDGSTQPTVTGHWSTSTAGANLAAALASLGLIINHTST